MKNDDPFVALVDFMAFMVLISVFMFIISESNIPDEEGSKADVLSFRVTTKSVAEFTHTLYVNSGEGKPTTDVEYSLWIVNGSGKAKLAEHVLDQLVVRSVDNQSSVFGVYSEEAGLSSYLLSFSHLENLDLVGTFMEMAIDVQIGRQSCAVDWSGKLGFDAGVLIDFDNCSAS